MEVLALILKHYYIVGMTLVSLIGIGWLPSAASAMSAQEPTICLDAGHQQYGNNKLEPVGPGSTEMKAKVSSGTRGVQTKKPEYVLNLEASVLMQRKLEDLGYKVITTRDTHNVDLSNKERANVCNQANADLALRIHADGDTSPQTKGLSVLYPAQSGYSQNIYSSSKAAAQHVLEEAVKASGASSRGIIPRSDLSGFNWSEVPTILLEMGFMSNPEEDKKLSDPEYLERLAQGVVKGINHYFAVEPEGTLMESDDRVYLPDDSRLYELVDGQLIRTSLALSAQTVQTSAVRGSWSQVNTWVGERWVYTGQAPVGVSSLDIYLELSQDTPMYVSPLDRTPLAELSPQKVYAYEKWKDWFLIKTWLGGVWIKPSN
ncbi:N-acetylmuramoyl-L-alanine amidase AmiB precursor [compost metagenome]